MQKPIYKAVFVILLLAVASCGGGGSNDNAQEVTSLNAAAASPGSIVISWAYVGASSFLITRNDSESFDTIATSYTDTGLSPDTEYCYIVTALNSSGQALAKSAPMCATTFQSTADQSPTPPLVPFLISAKHNEVVISWQPPKGSSSAALKTAANNVAGYNIYRNGKLIGTGTGVTFTDTNVSCPAVYTYTITWFDSDGIESPASEGIYVRIYSGWCPFPDLPGTPPEDNCQIAAPALALAPLNGVRNTLYALTITNNDSAGCADELFNLSVVELYSYGGGDFTLPSVLSSNIITLSPGQTDNTITLTVTWAGTVSSALQSRVDAASANHALASSNTVLTSTGCFGPDTDVLMADGSLRKISALNEGDMVEGYDFQSKSKVKAKVLMLHTHTQKGYLILNGTIKVTASHPFAVGDGMWKQAGKLKTGDELLTKTGKVKVISIEKSEKTLEVFNLSVESPHTYYVSGGGETYLVHNK